MTRFVQAARLALLPFITLACADAARPPGTMTGPGLSLTGARGVSADITRTVTEVRSGIELPLMRTDTTVWAPFDAAGWANPGNGAGTPGPVGVLYRSTRDGGGRTHVSRFVDDQGRVHELRLSADAPGPWSRITYVRGGRLVLEHRASWARVDGGWTVVQESATYQLGGDRAVRVAVGTRRMLVASRPPWGHAVADAGTLLHGTLTPRPLAAQWFFRECSTEWLKWVGAALLAEVAWGQYVATKSPVDLNKALAATTAAGVALGGLVDCMVVQPELPSADTTASGGR